MGETGNYAVTILFVLAIAGSVVMLLRRRYVWSAGLAILGCVGFFFLPSLLTGGDSESAKGAPLPSPSIQAAEGVVGTSSMSDPSGLWAGLVVLLVLISLGILSAPFLALARTGGSRRPGFRARREAEAADRREALDLWQEFMDRHERLREMLLKIEGDGEMFFRYPALFDGGLAQIQELRRAMEAVDSLSTTPPRYLRFPVETLPYPKRVAEAEDAWQRAWSFAKSRGTRTLPRQDRRVVNRILKELRLARDRRASSQERAVAYARVRELISELQSLHVPDAVLESMGIERRSTATAMNAR